MPGALEGITMLELCRVSPAELPGMMLADLGADVLRVETPQPGAAARSPEEERHIVSAHTNRNKRSIALDMKRPEGRSIFRQLAAKADVVIEGFRPGVMDRLGAGYAELAAGNPRLIMCSMSGFGQTGPSRNRAAHDLNFLALSGALSLWGKPGAAPDIPLNLVADLGGAAMHAAFAIMAALFAREKSGLGQHIDLSYLDATVALLAATPNQRRFDEARPPRADEGVFSGTYPYYGLYATADQRWLSVACSEPHLWRNFCDAIGTPELAPFARQASHYGRTADPDESKARAAVQRVLVAHELSHWEGIFADADVCVAPVAKLDEMRRDPQVVHRGLITTIEHPSVGPVTQFASAVRLSATPARIPHAAPLPGEHTVEVLRALGLPADVIENLRNAHVIE
nr:CaiB/BaiF CoA-transferase family protein [Schlegelella koreensis]